LFPELVFLEVLGSLGVLGILDILDILGVLGIFGVFGILEWIRNGQQFVGSRGAVLDYQRYFLDAVRRENKRGSRRCCYGESRRF
jgi:membrane protein required for beta-lactamase induction